MSLVPKNNWRPNTSVDTLKKRADLIARVREFFSQRGVLEVMTPIMAPFGVTDPHLQSIKTEDGFYLQTSPEYHMKRLLAADSGPIFEICKSFRREENGRLHSCEFTMLEWYRPGFNHTELMQEVNDLLKLILNTNDADLVTYSECFLTHLNINPHTCTVEELKQCALKNKINPPELENKDDWLGLLLTHLIEPKLGKKQPTFIYDFPASQSALAKIRDGVHPVAERFEVYFKGIELANGYHELTDAQEQKKRFSDNNKQRRAMGLPEVAVDHHLVAALESGLPESSGVALGLDRLIMLALGEDNIAAIQPFTVPPFTSPLAGEGFSKAYTD